ncbi:MAG TPA: hypothetical protein VFA20_22350 [Myxococcaceae bacterium]|nr:hypothetical protein [Myxococcaceae bacterium]
MRWLCVALVFASAACGVKSITRADRVAASIAASKMKDGTVLTDAQVAMLDQDQTYECHREMELGSHIPKLTCRTLRRIENDTVKTKQQITTMQTASSLPAKGL